MKILITGAAGYIGSHAAVGLLEKNHDLILLDNFSNSSKKNLSLIKKISKKDFYFYEADIRNQKALEDIFDEHRNIEAIFHFAALKSVKSSFKNSDLYYEVNVKGTKILLDAIEKKLNKKINFIYSSTAGVYGVPQYIPINEKHPQNPVNPYGENKLEIEKFLKLKFKKNKEWKIICLRYFNAIGSHQTYLIGDNPLENPENLMPYLTRVAKKIYDKVQIFGNDYSTEDGTPIRDYIHVMDLIDGHLAALNYIKNKKSAYEIINLGTGKGFSVLEMINVFSKVNNINVPFEIVGRRTGDVEVSFADTSKAKRILNWKSKRKIEEMCLSSWKFQKNIDF